MNESGQAPSLNFDYATHIGSVLLLLVGDGSVGLWKVR